MKRKKVSIIIPVFNTEHYVSECLKSAIDQDYPEIEIIVVNDGSTDNSLKEIEKLQKEHTNIRVISTKNQGQSAARNIALSNSTGEYILFLDSDDKIEKKTISTSVQTLEDLDTDMVFFEASSFCDGESPDKLKEFNYRRHPSLHYRRIDSREFFRISVKLKCHIVSPCLYIFKKSKFPNIRFLPGIVHEDNLFTTRMITEHEGRTVTCIPDEFFKRRIRPNSTMTERKGEKHINGYFKVAEELFSLQTSGFSSKEKSALYSFIQDMICGAIISCCDAHKKFPLNIRIRSASLLLRIPLRSLRIKAMVLCAAPKIVNIKRLIINRKSPRNKNA